MQWLDDLDDLVFASLLVWRRGCRLALCVGLAAALVLALPTAVDIGRQWLIGLSVIAAISVLAWCIAAVSVWAAAWRGVRLGA